MQQLKLDFTSKPIISGKKNQRLAIPCSDEFMEFMDLLSNMVGKSRAELAFDFVLEGMQRALGNVFMAEPRMDKKLRDLLSQHR
jgi:hypothetical protein